MVTGSGRQWNRVDQVMLCLVRLVHDDQWSAGAAASELRRQGHERGALTVARARVAAAAVERSSRYGDRAMATLDAALGRRTSAPPLATSGVESGSSRAPWSGHD